MKEILRTYNTQFQFRPEIVNEHLIKKNFKQIVLCGMGGSHLSTGLLKIIEPGLDLYVHRDYDVPPFSKTFLESSLLIASSYSGNTEETISFYKKIKQLYDLPVLCISVGGELIELAQKNNDPYIVLPKTEFVPRTALGVTTIAIASILKDKGVLYNLQNLTLDVSQIENDAKKIYNQITSSVPIFYSSNQNLGIAYNWKIKLNETAKQMAFYNIFPEFNHNELESYEFLDNSKTFIPILMRDNDDGSKIKKRFDVFESILREKNISYLSIDISNTNTYKKVFNSVLMADFVSAYIAESKGVPLSEVPLIEEFKKRLV